MERWVIYAIISMVFAGLTAVIAKMGLTGISAELGMAVRTCFVFVLVLAFAACVVPIAQTRALTWPNIGWLCLSGLTTAISWVFYYKAVKEGKVSTVALIDKGSFVVAVNLSWLLLREHISPRTILGGLLIVSGLAVVARG